MTLRSVSLRSGWRATSSYRQFSSSNIQPGEDPPRLTESWSKSMIVCFKCLPRIWVLAWMAM